jgi:sulfur-carrier protein
MSILVNEPVSERPGAGKANELRHVPQARRRTAAENAMIRVVLPYHLRTLAGVNGEAELAVQPPVTVASVLDALEARYPNLRGTIRDHVTRQRRPFLRFYACQQDLSNDPTDRSLPEQIATGAEPLLIVGAIAGG